MFKKHKMFYEVFKNFFLFFLQKHVVELLTLQLHPKILIFFKTKYQTCRSL